MQKFLFVDLDDTLFQTPAKCPPGSQPEAAADLPDGSPGSFTTARQRAFLALAQREMTLIPVTARNGDAFRRTRIPFAHGAIINYGGVILDAAGEPDPVWAAQMAAEMALALPWLQAMQESIARYVAQAGLPARIRMVVDYGTTFYLVVKDNEGVAQRLVEIQEAVVSPGLPETLMIHRNGNNLAILPRSLHKGRAVQRILSQLRAQHGELLTFGMGDSLSDAGFMSACDYAIVPQGSQLAKATLAAL